MLWSGKVCKLLFSCLGICLVKVYVKIIKNFFLCHSWMLPLSSCNLLFFFFFLIFLMVTLLFSR